jgi:hypothetical protein
MARAAYVTSAIGTLITGVNAKQSTKPLSGGSAQNRFCFSRISLANIPTRLRPRGSLRSLDMQFTAPLLYEIGRAA